jgi:hypothetical protein
VVLGVWEELEELVELVVWEASAEWVVPVASEEWVASASQEASVVSAVPANLAASVVLEESAARPVLAAWEEPVERGKSGSTIPRTGKALAMVTPPLRRNSIAAPARIRQRAIHSEARITSVEARAPVVAEDQTSADAAVPEQERARVVAVDQTLADAAVREEERAHGPAPARETAAEARLSAIARAAAAARSAE